MFDLADDGRLNVMRMNARQIASDNVFTANIRRKNEAPHRPTI